MRLEQGSAQTGPKWFLGSMIRKLSFVCVCVGGYHNWGLDEGAARFSQRQGLSWFNILVVLKARAPKFFYQPAQMLGRENRMSREDKNGTFTL